MAQYMHSNKGAPHSDIIAPLRALTILHARFKWTRECHSSREGSLIRWCWYCT